MAANRKAKPPQQAAPTVSKNALKTCGDGPKVCNPAFADDSLAVFMPLVKQQLSMQAIPRANVGLSPTRLRSGRIVGKVYC